MARQRIKKPIASAKVNESKKISEKIGDKEIKQSNALKKIELLVKKY